MNIYRIFCLVGVALTILFVGSTFAVAQVIDGPVARKHLERQARDLLYQEKFDELEKLAREFRRTKAKLPDGTWKLLFFYEGFSAPKNKSSDGWKRFIDKFDKWLKKYPGSVTARNAAAYAWMEYGWDARGGGYASSVSDEGWRLLNERLKKSYSLLEKKPARPSDDCPERYNLLLGLATAQGWARPQYEALFHEAITFEPTYLAYYLEKAGYLEPKWHGEEGEWQKFARDAVSLTPASEGKAVYMRILGTAWMEKSFKSFSEDGISWELMKQGFIDTERNSPDSPWNLNNFCKFACLAGDKETAQRLFKRIGDRPYMEAWEKRAEFEKWQKWAGVVSQNEGKTKSLYSEDLRQLLQLAEESGDAEAFYQAGQIYEHGEQVTKDFTAAAKLYRKAADRGHAEAQDALGVLYYNGSDPIKKDYKEAMKWFYLAAIQGNYTGADSLGEMFYGGWGVEKDPIRAYVWLKQETRYKDTRLKEIAEKLTPEQLKQAELEATKLKDEIRNNKVAAEMTPPDPAKIQLPKVTFKPEPQSPKQSMIPAAPPAKVATGNLLNGTKWQVSGGAQGVGNAVSIKNVGQAVTLIKIDPLSSGCLFVGANVKYSRPQAGTTGLPVVPFFMGSTIFQGQQGLPMGMRLLISPTLKEKNEPLWKAFPISSQFDSIKVSFGTLDPHIDDKTDFSTEFSDIRVMIFPTCEEAKAAGNSFYKK